MNWVRSYSKLLKRFEHKSMPKDGVTLAVLAPVCLLGYVLVLGTITTRSSATTRTSNSDTR